MLFAVLADQKHLAHLLTVGLLPMSDAAGQTVRWSPAATLTGFLVRAPLPAALKHVPERHVSACA